MNDRTMTRRSMIAGATGAMSGLGVGVKLMGAVNPLRAECAGGVEPRIEKGVAWYDVAAWGVEGRAWTDQDRERYFDRLPAKAKGKVRQPVWDLGRHSAGMSVRFETDATTIHVRYALLNASLAMPHMPATGVSGVDLYATDEMGRWRWAGVTKPARQQVADILAKDLAAGRRAYMMYLPLYNGVESMSVGVAEKAMFEPIAPRSAKPIVFYGTSIMHGACASRPGMSITGILGRRMDRPTVNLGFSGNGTMDASVGELLAQVDAAAFVIDCLPNMGADQVAARTGPLVRQLRASRTAPIVLVEDRRNTNSWILPDRSSHHVANHKALRAEFEKLRAAGVGGLYFLEGDRLLGDDAEGATDGSHPSDLGMLRYADAYEPVLREALTA